MKEGGTGGSHTRTGSKFEKWVDMANYLNTLKGYKVVDGKVFFQDKLIARLFKKMALYKFLQSELNVNWEDHISVRLVPDDSIYILVHNRIFIVECKYQKVHGSTDEKLQTCDFKKKQYIKLFSKTGIIVEFVYLLNDWFEHKRYDDVKEYIKSVGCQFFIEDIPLTYFGLPLPLVE